jgi:hypothetical protein
MPAGAGSIELIKHLEAILEEGKKKKRDSVYDLS